MTCRQDKPADAGRGRSSARFGHTANRQARRLGVARQPFQCFDIRHLGIEKIKSGECVRQQFRVGEAGEAIVRRYACHGDRALGECLEAVALKIVRRNHGLLTADNDAQAKIVPLGTLRLLNGAVAYLDR